MMIEFTDSHSRKRTDVDGNNQYLDEAVGVFPPYGETWHLADTWSLYLAAKLIATGWPNLDIEADKDDAKLAICKRSDAAKGRLRAYFHFVELANIAIKAGILSDNDSPHAWLDWAQSKHYKIDHLTKYLDRPLSDDDAAFFAGIDAMLEPCIKPIDYGQAAPDVVDTTNKANDRPPGITDGMVTITKLAITAAWEIEGEIKRKATANEVIKRLQEWVTSSRYAELIEIIPHGVKWMTTAPDEKSYDIDACRATLKAWKKTEPKQSLEILNRDKGR